MDGSTTSSFDSLVTAYRRRAGLTQEMLSERTGVSVRAISDIERARAKWPQRRTTDALALALGLDAAEREDFLRAASAGKVTPAPSPHQWSRLPDNRPGGLPALVADVVGRDAELHVLGDLARSVATEEPPHDRGTAVLHGAPGAGKTSLAIKAGHLLANLFPDGQLMVNLNGFGVAPADPMAVLRKLLLALGADEAHIPAGSGERIGLYRTLLRGKRILLILDDAANESQVRPLIAAQAHCFTLITSRRTLSGLGSARRVSLSGLTTHAAEELLRSIVGGARVDAEPSAAPEVVELCGRLPLALRIAGNRLASRPQWPVAYLAEQLRDRERSISALTAGDLRIRQAFEMSYAHLGRRGASMFRTLGVLFTSDIELGLAAAVADGDRRSTRDALEELADATLVERAANGEYSIHPLIRAFAGRLAKEVEPARIPVVEHRATDWLFATTRSAASHFRPTGVPVHHAMRPLTGSRCFPDATSAKAWLVNTADTLDTAMVLAAGAGRHDAVVDVAMSLVYYVDVVPDRLLWKRVYRTALESARSAGRTDEAIGFLLVLADTISDLLQQPVEAQPLLAEARRLAEENALIGHYGSISLRFAENAIILGRGEEAEAAATTAVREFTAADDTFGLYRAKSLLGAVRRNAGHTSEGVELHSQVVAHFRAVSESGTQVDLGFLGRSLMRLGNSLSADGQTASALLVFDEMLELFYEIDIPIGQALARYYRAEALRSAGRVAEAENDLRTGLTIFRHIGDLAMEVHSLRVLAEAAEAAGDHAEAAALRADALRACENWDSPQAQPIADALRAARNSGVQ